MYFLVQIPVSFQCSILIFTHKLKNKNSGVRFQERCIPVKFKMSLQ